jgi:hypothetical protein
MSLAIDGGCDLVNAVLLRRPFCISTDLLLDFSSCSLFRETPDTLFCVLKSFSNQKVLQLFTNRKSLLRVLAILRKTTTSRTSHLYTVMQAQRPTTLANNSSTEPVTMSSPILHSILQGHYVPDFIYRSTDGSVYFTRPSRTSGSTFCGYDQQTNLPMYGLTHEVPIGGNTQRIARGVYAGSFGPTASNVESDPQPTHQPHTISLKRAITSRNLLRDSQRQARAESRRREQNLSRRTTVQPDGMPSGDRGHAPGRQERSSPYSVNIGGQLTSESQDRNNAIREPVRADSYHHSERSRASESRRETDSTFPVETSTFGLQSTSNAQNSTTTRALTQALKERYELDSMAEAGHLFDNVDDTFIHAQINAYALHHSWAPHVYLTVGQETGEDSPVSWFIDIPYLELPQDVLEVHLPLDQTSLLDLTNDVLRVLHVHIADPDHRAPVLASLSAAELTESCRLILQELENRGFTEHVPHVVRLRGLKHRASTCTPVPTSSSKPSRKGAQKGSAGEASHCMDCCDHKSRQQVTQDPESSTLDSTGEASEKRNRKAPVDKDYDADSSDHSDGTTPSGMTPIEDSTSEDGLVYGKSKAHAAENTSRPGSGYDAKMGQAYIDRGPEHFLEGLIPPLSDY